MEEGGLGERGESREAGFQSDRPGVGVDKPGHGSGFIAFDGICILTPGVDFFIRGGGGGGWGRLGKYEFETRREF